MIRGGDLRVTRLDADGDPVGEPFGVTDYGLVDYFGRAVEAFDEMTTAIRDFTFTVSLTAEANKSLWRLLGGEEFAQRARNFERHRRRLHPKPRVRNKHGRKGVAR